MSASCKTAVERSSRAAGLRAMRPSKTRDSTSGSGNASRSSRSSRMTETQFRHHLALPSCSCTKSPASSSPGCAGACRRWLVPT
eukprot:803278-Pleurochrysis_carterae.AAC.1